MIEINYFTMCILQQIILKMGWKIVTATLEHSIGLLLCTWSPCLK